MEFSGKVALVTGAGSGVGEATARALAAGGAAVGLLDQPTISTAPIPWRLGWITGCVRV